MDLLGAMQIFHKVAREGSFAAAARRANVAPSVVTRTINALEAHLGTKLVIRSTRALRLTEAGDTYLTSSARVLHEVARAEEDIRGGAGSISGKIRFTAPRLFGRLHLLPALRGLMFANPGLKLEGLYTDETISLIETEVDIGVRIGPLPDSAYRAIRVGATQRVLCAAPDYLSQTGKPLDKPDHLLQHRLISPGSRLGKLDWEIAPAQRHAPCFSVSDHATAIDAALDGWGVTEVYHYQVAKDLADGRLVELLPNWPRNEDPIHLLHAYDKTTPRHIRVALDTLAATLKANPVLGGLKQSQA